MVKPNIWHDGRFTDILVTEHRSKTNIDLFITWHSLFKIALRGTLFNIHSRHLDIIEFISWQAALYQKPS